MTRKYRFAGLAAGTLFALSGLLHPSVAAAQAQSAMRADVVEFRATVESVDQSTRSVLLRGEDGILATVKVGPQVRNLPQVKAGNVVVLQYGEALIAQPVGKAAGKAEPQAATAFARAPKGAMPGAIREDAVTVRVKITAIDLPHNVVTATGPSGKSLTTTVRNADMQRLLRTLKVGDDVDLTFVRAVALRVVSG